MKARPNCAITSKRCSTMLGTRPEMASITGASDFTQAAESMLKPAGGKTPSEFVALDAVQHLLSAFNALVLD